VVQFRAFIFDVVASVLHRLDGGQPTGAATGRFLCGGFLSRKRDIHLFDLGAYRTKSAGPYLDKDAQDHPASVSVA
jgi:hypothetical protein